MSVKRTLSMLESRIQLDGLGLGSDYDFGPEVDTQPTVVEQSRPDVAIEKQLPGNDQETLDVLYKKIEKAECEIAFLKSELDIKIKLKAEIRTLTYLQLQPL